MQYLLAIALLTLISQQSFGQSPAPTNDVQSDPKKQKEFNKKKAKMVAKEKRDVEQAKKDILRAQSPEVRRRMKKNLKKANKFNGAKRKGEDPYN